MALVKLFRHVKCRNTTYPNSEIVRFAVPDEVVDWQSEYTSYNPPTYDSPVLDGKPWADPKLKEPGFEPKFNALDGHVNRQSHCGTYDLCDGYPLNPYGRTGLRGRGLLGRYGPNHAADPIVTRWKRWNNNAIAKDDSSKLPILQMCIIKRVDNGELALPGGMVDPGESISETLRREFAEEALSGQDGTVLDLLADYFHPGKGTEIYRHYVDDPRNTDHAWMETVAMHFHDDDGTRAGRLQLRAGDDAAHVQWTDIDGGQQFYANHRMFIEQAVRNLNAHW